MVKCTCIYTYIYTFIYRSNIYIYLYIPTAVLWLEKTETPSITLLGNLRRANMMSLDSLGRFKGFMTMGVVVYDSFNFDLKVKANVIACKFSVK